MSSTVIIICSFTRDINIMDKIMWLLIWQSYNLYRNSGTNPFNFYVTSKTMCLNKRYVSPEGCPLRNRQHHHEPERSEGTDGSAGGQGTEPLHPPDYPQDGNCRLDEQGQGHPARPVRAHACRRCPHEDGETLLRRRSRVTFKCEPQARNTKQD